METTGGGRNFQFRATGINSNEDMESRMARFDVNPADGHVLRSGAHLNLETHINGVPTQNLHIPRDPNTVLPGDIP